MNALARTFMDIFFPLNFVGEDQWKLEVAKPLLERLDSMGTGWHSEEAVCGGNPGMSIIGARCFWAKDLGLIEYKRRHFRRDYWLRLTPRGLRYLRSLDE